MNKHTQEKKQDRQIVKPKGIFGWSRWAFYSALLGASFGSIFVIDLILNTLALNSYARIAVAILTIVAFFIFFLLVVLANTILIVIYEMLNRDRNRNLRFIVYVYIVVFVGITVLYYYALLYFYR